MVDNAVNEKLIKKLRELVKLASFIQSLSVEGEFPSSGYEKVSVTFMIKTRPSPRNKTKRKSNRRGAK